jgi:cell wall-associated NlpC family hydrolase
MSNIGEKVVSAARLYRGVKWEHQGRTAQGMDCCGFVVEVAIKSGATGGVDFERDYRRAENGERMIELLTQYLNHVVIEEATSDSARNPLAHAEVGDVLALCDSQLKYRDKPTHLAFLTQLSPYPMMIHCSEHGVTEHRIDIHFKERICSVWHYRPDNSELAGAPSDFQPLTSGETHLEPKTPS